MKSDSATKTILVALLMLCAVATPTKAQVTTATLSGIVEDNTGAVIPGAAVRLTNEGTNRLNATTTGESGEFVYNFIQPGTYTLEIESPSFKLYRSTSLELGAAQQVRRRFTLELGAVTETIEVAAEAAMVNTVSSEQREALVSKQVTELPIARRNFSAILNQGAGVVAAGNGKFNLNGLGGAGASITVDGTEASADARSSGTSMFSGFNRIDLLSLESIQEIQVIKGVIPAEYGQALSGNINVITRSGTNDYHGSLFYNYQGSALSARHQFTAEKPNFVWNQFGGSVGGRVIRDKLFFFFAYEGYRESTFQFLSGQVPTASFRQQMLTSLPFAETQLLLDTTPTPNTPHAPDAISGVWQGAASSSADDNHTDLKMDYRVGNYGNLGVTYTRGRPNTFIPRIFPANPRTFGGKNDRITSTYTHGGSNWTSETRFGFNYNITNRLDDLYNIVDPNTSETIEGQRRLPTLRCDSCPFNITGGEIRNEDPRPFYSFEEKFAYVAGRHSLKVGGIWSYRGSGRFNVEGAVVRYSNADDLLNNVPNTVQTTFGTPKFIGRDYQLGFFAQDDWRVTSRLVVNIGLRYDFFSNYVAEGEDQNDPFLSAGLFNPDGLLDSSFHIGAVRDPSNPIDADKMNLGPRIGFSFNPDGDGRTTIRGGYSVMFKQVPIAHYLLSVGRSPILPFRTVWSRAEAESLGFKFPIYNEDVLPVLQDLGQVRIEQMFNPQLDNPYAQNIYLGIQRAIGGSLVYETALIATRGVKFTMEREANQVDRFTGERPNPDIGGFTYLDNSQQTFYWGWQNSLRKRFSQGLLFNLHYTYGKALAYAGGDTATGAEGELTTSIQDFFCVSCERGHASSDIRHNFTANWLYELPFLRNASSKLLSSVLGGWQVSGTLIARTGTPFNIEQPGAIPGQRPDISTLEAAQNDECCGFGNLQYLNRSAFTLVPINSLSRAQIRPGSLPNHALREPGLWNVDFGLGKNFRIKEGSQLQIRADFLNAFNHTNYTSIRTDINSSSFGTITNTAGARVIQVNGRLSF